MINMNTSYKFHSDYKHESHYDCSFGFSFSTRKYEMNKLVLTV